MDTEKESRVIDGGNAMRQEVVDFYRGNNTPIEKIVNIGVCRHGHSEESLRKAAENLYDEIQAGLEVRPIRIAWEVFSRAKLVRAAKAEGEQGELSRLSDENEILREKLSQNSTWWDKLSQPQPHQEAKDYSKDFKRVTNEISELNEKITTLIVAARKDSNADMKGAAAVAKLEVENTYLRNMIDGYAAYCASPWWKRLRRFVEQ